MVMGGQRDRSGRPTDLAEPPRSWTLEDIGERPLTINRVMKMHRQEWATHTRETRERFGWLAREARIPKLSRVRVAAVPLHADRRSPQDVAACAAHVKAAVDGALVDAGVVPDDNPEYLTAIEFRPPEVCGRDGLRLIIEAVT